MKKKDKMPFFLCVFHMSTLIVGILFLTCHTAVAQLEVLTLLAPVVPQVTDRALNHRVLGTFTLALNM